MNEAQLVRKILKYLNSLPHCKAIKYHGNNFSHNGTPDIIACSRGRMILFEVKVGNNKPTMLQQIEIERWKKAGALAYVVYSLDEVKTLMEVNG